MIDFAGQQPPPGQLQRAGAGHACPWPSSSRTCSPLPDQPDWVPYRTSYYAERWGFCLSQRDCVDGLPDGDYEVCVDTTLADGHLTYGECLVCRADRPTRCWSPATSATRRWPTTTCPGIAVASRLARLLRAAPPRHTYRFLFIPGTIGSITWLARNEDRTAAGSATAWSWPGVGDPGGFTYKRSRRGDAEIDRAVAHVLGRSGRDHRVIDFSPYGYDERQFCSPGFDLPVGRLSRTPARRPTPSTTPRPTTSTCRARPSSPESLELLPRGRSTCSRATGATCNLSPKGEPQLGRRGLYGRSAAAATPRAARWPCCGC